MTAGTDGTGVGSPATAVAGDQVLARAAGVQLLGEVPGSGYRNPPALVRRADGQVVTLTPLLQQVMHAVDGRRTVAEVAPELTGRIYGPETAVFRVVRGPGAAAPSLLPR